MISFQKVLILLLGIIGWNFGIWSAGGSITYGSSVVGGLVVTSLFIFFDVLLTNK